MIEKDLKSVERRGGLPKPEGKPKIAGKEENDRKKRKETRGIRKRRVRGREEVKEPKIPFG